MSGKSATNLFAGLEQILTENEPLARHTWLGIGGPARFFLQPTTEQQLRTVMQRCAENSLPLRIIGQGSILLVDDHGIDAAVLRLGKDGELSDLQVNGSEIIAGAAVGLNRLVLRTVREGLTGIECLIGIPGTVGGAININAGGNFGDIGAVINRVKIMDSSGTVFYRERPELVFAYRQTNIGDAVVLQGQFNLTKDDPQPVLRRVREIWMLKKANQPLSSHSAGCIFKNPPRQVSAGALIDQAGLKGKQVGKAMISAKHANFIVTEPGVTFQDVQDLITLVQDKVYDQFDIRLELEIQIWQ